MKVQVIAFIVAMVVSLPVVAQTREIQCSGKGKQGNKSGTISLVIGNCGSITDCTVRATFNGKSTNYSRVKRSKPAGTPAVRRYTKASDLNFTVPASATNGSRLASGQVKINKKNTTFSKINCQVVDPTPAS